MQGDIITVFNRCPRALVVMKDGRTTTLDPGLNQITSDLFSYARDQHPVPGTEDPQSLAFESFVSYVANPRRDEVQRDSLDMFDEDVLALLPRERINRLLLAPDRQRGTEVANRFPQGRVGVEAPTSGMIDPGKFTG